MTKKYRFHIPALVHLPVSEKYAGCAFTQKIFKFSKMMLSLGYEVFVYGCEGGDVPCTEYIETHTLSDLRKEWGEGDNRYVLGYNWKKKGFKHDINKERTSTTKKFYANCIEEINKRKQPDDFLLITQGSYQKPIDEGVNLFLTCEPGIGYRGSYCKYRAFESSYIQNFTYGSEHPRQSIDGNFYDVVIPNYFDPEQFDFKKEKQDYFLYIGRLIQRKGVMIAHKICQEIGETLKLAGQGVKSWDGRKLVCDDFTIEGDHLDYVGYADIEKRKELYANAKATFVPTIYLEPFGGTSIESLLSGTPVITTNFGVFPETIPHAHVGYRCQTLDQFVWAAKNIDKINPQDCYDYAMANFTLEKVASMFEEWFNSLYYVYESVQDKNKKGWHRITERSNLDWLKKYYS
jgi:glycosyltransferase involved in cell wall biosynthesis